MKIPLINAILAMLLVAYVYAAWTFMRKQKEGASFIASIDKALSNWGGFVVLGLLLSIALTTYGNLPQGII